MLCCLQELLVCHSWELPPQVPCERCTAQGGLARPALRAARWSAHLRYLRGQSCMTGRGLKDGGDADGADTQRVLGFRSLR